MPAIDWLSGCLDKQRATERNLVVSMCSTLGTVAVERRKLICSEFSLGLLFFSFFPAATGQPESSFLVDFGARLLSFGRRLKYMLRELRWDREADQKGYSRFE